MSRTDEDVRRLKATAEHNAKAVRHAADVREKWRRSIEASASAYVDAQRVWEETIEKRKKETDARRQPLNASASSYEDARREWEEIIAKRNMEIHARRQEAEGQEAEGQETEGRKDDDGKLPYHLVPWDAMRGVVTVLNDGAEKYGARNWEHGMNWSRPYAAAIRHLEAWWQGEDKDPESGRSHLWHAGCCVLFLIAYELRCLGRDDRPKG